MQLSTLITFDPDDDRVYPPESYREQFPYVIFVRSTDFKFFDDCSLRLKMPTIEDLMKEAGIDESGYLVFGQSTSWGWSDLGSVYYFAIALKTELNKTVSKLVDLMWMRWLREHLNYPLCITNENGYHSSGSITYASSEKDAKMHGYFGNPIYSCFVIDSYEENGVTMYKCYKYGETLLLNRQQLAEWIKTGEVVNATVGKTPLKNGEPRISIKENFKEYNKTDLSSLADSICD